MDEKIDASIAAQELKLAGKDVSKQIPALLKLGDWYLNSAKKTALASNFTKANALYCAALVRSKLVNKGSDDDQIIRRIVETYRQFLHAFASGEEISSDEIRNEINSHKEFLDQERRSIKVRIDEIDTSFKNKNDKLTDQQYEVMKKHIFIYFRIIKH